ncbi:aminoacyl-tRNA hydrolase [Methylonatrum kenyense]|nr:aminoacyl-tRNA hydrolase [Methylonatrum kenyense]MCK8516518.1 aminoacyl-tRNA hydrolase [Methylonatrum kenyense]
MADAIQLIVGLGNPGEKYTATRHNAGFWFLDELTRRHGGSLRSEAKFFGEAGRITVEGRDVHLLKPMTFMNRSGQAVAALANFFKLPTSAILLAHDELDLAPGTARLKRGGGHGGHNGLRDTERALGGRDYLRLRLGIGHPGDARLVTPWVLGKPAADDRVAIEQAIDRAADAMPRLIAGDLERVMNELHAK